MAWDPTAARRRTPQRIDIPSSDGQAWVEVTPWDTGTRLAYEDGLMDAVRIDFNDTTGQPIRRLIPSVMQRLHLRLTITACGGFPELPTLVEDPDTGEARPGPAVPFDFARPEHVDALDPDVFAEVVALAADVVPLPTNKVKRPEDHKAKAPADAKPEEAGDFTVDGDDDEDPRTPPSRPASPRRRSASAS